MNIVTFFSSLRNRLLVVAYDFLAIFGAWFGAYWLRYDDFVKNSDLFYQAVAFLPIVLLFQVVSYSIFGLHRGIWRFASLPDLIRIFKAVLFGGFSVLFFLFLFTRLDGVPRSIIPMYAMLLILFLGGARFSFRHLKNTTSIFGHRVLIIGANKYGEVLVRELLREKNLGIPIAFVDNNVKQVGQEIQGIRVCGQYNDIATIVKNLKIDLIIIAIPYAVVDEIHEVVKLSQETMLPVRVLPSMVDILSGKISLQSLREISLEDLLGRAEVSIKWDLIAKEIKNKVIFITGAGGSVGSELCRQIASLDPMLIVLVENSEFNLFKIREHLIKAFPYIQLSAHLVSITDVVGIKSIMSKYKPDVVFHAAAYKHVPLLELEDQVREAARNNIIGTKIIAEISMMFGVQKFVLVSTDKAVNPANVMGKTKRIAEMLCHKFNAKQATKFIVVRFGNVLGSVGSVVPIFQQQIDNGGPVTITHPDMKRYFMSIPEAAQLILQTIAFGNGGETFVLDMGSPVKIKDLAEHMIRLSGKKPNIDIKIEYIGLRLGEKLDEELFYKHENLSATPHSKVMKSLACKFSYDKLPELLHSLESSINNHEIANINNLIERILSLEIFTADQVLVEDKIYVEGKIFTEKKMLVEA